MDIQHWSLAVTVQPQILHELFTTFTTTGVSRTPVVPFPFTTTIHSTFVLVTVQPQILNVCTEGSNPGLKLQCAAVHSAE